MSVRSPKRKAIAQSIPLVCLVLSCVMVHGFVLDQEPRTKSELASSQRSRQAGQFGFSPYTSSSPETLVEP